MCIFDLKINLSDIVAFFALLVSGTSAFFAFTSWKEAKKANRISLLSSINEIYDAFFELEKHISQKSQFAEISEVSKFYYYSRKSKNYLPSDIAEDIKLYFNACFWLADMRSKNGGITNESGIDAAPYLEIVKTLAPKIDNAFCKLLQKLLD